MRRFVCFFLAVVSVTNLLGASTAFSQVETKTNYRIDNSHSSIVFAVSHLGLSYTYGRFNKFSGKFALEDGDLTSAGFEFQIRSNSIDTNNQVRDDVLKSPDFFDAKQFPSIKFVTTGFSKQEDTYRLRGDLTMLGQTNSITMPVRQVGMGVGPLGQRRVGYLAKFTIKRSDFGMDKMLKQIGDDVSITFSFEGVQQ